MTSRVESIPEGYHGVTPYLMAALWLSFRWLSFRSLSFRSPARLSIGPPQEMKFCGLIN
jgi:hypothetical protein